VYLVAPASYLGDDIAAHFDYWLREEDELSTEMARQLFQAGADRLVTPPTPIKDGVLNVGGWKSRMGGVFAVFALPIVILSRRGSEVIGLHNALETNMAFI